MAMTAVPKLFNSPLEAGARTIAVLTAFYPRSLELRQLSLYDYFVVHTGDIDGPQSLHPEIDVRMGEFFIRRRLVEEGIAMMQKAGLVREEYDENGVAYKATEAATSMFDLASTNYNRQLYANAQWLAQQQDENPAREENLFSLIDKWKLEFGLSNTDGEVKE